MATRADVKHAFRKQARKHHPDTGGDAAKFRELVEAKERVLAEWCSGA
jgi:curved DNA-binding protein